MLFELLVLSGAQVGSDWTSILKKRQDFRLDYHVVITDMAQTLYIKDVSKCLTRVMCLPRH
jgi:3-methyladenine DNA glycosylase Tag